MKKVISILMFIIAGFWAIGLIVGISIGEAMMSIFFATTSVVFAFLGIWLKPEKKKKQPKPNKIVVEQVRPVQQPIVANAVITKPEGTRNFDLLETYNQDEECALKYEYEVEMFVTAPELLKGKGGKDITFKHEPENEYDSEAIAIYVLGDKIGYAYKNRIRDMINDWMKHEDYFRAYINKFNIEAKTATFKIGFYKPLDYIECETYRITRISKKEEDFGNSRFENITCCDEGDELDLENLTLYDGSYSEIGELPSSAEKFINECEKTLVILSSLEIDDDDRVKAEATIYKLK